MWWGSLPRALATSALVFAYSVALGCASNNPPSIVAPSTAIAVLGERSLEGAPTDLRWDGESLLIADIERGLLRASWDTSEPAAVVEANEGRFHRWLRVASDGERRAGSFIAFGVWWSGPEAGAGEYAIEFPGDIDLHGDRLLVVGLRRDEAGLASDGYIAWTARLGEELSPVLPAHDGPGAPSMVRCALLELPRVRFLPDGRFVIAAGTEPGVQLYSSQGRLEGAWEAVSLGIDPGCTMNEELAGRMGTDEEARIDWRNERRLVDEILPTSDGFALVVRYRDAGVTRWDLVQPDVDGEIRHRTLPWSHPSKWVHLVGDVTEEKAAFLITSRGIGPDPESRLRVTTWPF